MSTAIASTGFTQEAFDAFLSARDEPGWLTDMRRGAWQRFQELPMPSVRDEEWMRTDIRLFKLDRFGVPEQATDLPPDVALPHALNVKWPTSAQIISPPERRSCGTSIY